MFPLFFPNNFVKLNQIEIGKRFIYVTTSQNINPIVQTKGVIGGDSNSTKHVSVFASNDGKIVMKMGKNIPHIRKKYSCIPKKLQKKNNKKLLRKLKNRERRLIEFELHRISKKIVSVAYKTKHAINLELLTDICKRAKFRKSQRHSLNSWPFYKLKTFIEYKASKLGVPVYYVNPQYTSKTCCKCWRIGTATTHTFKYAHSDCAYFVHRDVNASRVIISCISMNDCVQTKMYVKARSVLFEKLKRITQLNDNSSLSTEAIQLKH